ncbi:hypothetical protein M3Y99_00898700 [Aphelenchoides fujianensis]|nr:hypothetical protein M3Y99_00898700 [Aphelenchoides fujianensis]
MPADFSDATVAAFGAATVNVGVLLATVALLAVVFRMINRQVLPALSKTAAFIPQSADAVAYAEVPLAIVAVIAQHMQIPLEEVAAEYAKDANQRKPLVQQVFHKDDITKSFLDKHQSKFLQHGYAGEELLTAQPAAP